MGIKVTESNNKKPKFKYPCLVQTKAGTVILLTGEGTGTVVKAGRAVALGEHLTCWGTNCKLYDGSITLTNE